MNTIESEKTNDSKTILGHIHIRKNNTLFNNYFWDNVRAYVVFPTLVDVNRKCSNQQKQRHRPIQYTYHFGSNAKNDNFPSFCSDINPHHKFYFSIFSKSFVNKLKMLRMFGEDDYYENNKQRYYIGYRRKNCMQSEPVQLPLSNEDRELLQAMLDYA